MAKCYLNNSLHNYSSELSNTPVKYKGMLYVSQSQNMTMGLLVLMCKNFILPSKMLSVCKGIQQHYHSKSLPNSVFNSHR